MGIKGLTQLLKKLAPDSYQHCKLYKLSGKKLLLMPHYLYTNH